MSRGLEDTRRDDTRREDAICADIEIMQISLGFGQRWTAYKCTVDFLQCIESRATYQRADRDDLAMHPSPSTGESANGFIALRNCLCWTSPQAVSKDG